MLKRFFFGALCALMLCLPAFAEVDIPKDKRVKNFSSGCCVWCSVENLANVQHVTTLKGIAKYRHENYGEKKIWVEGTYVQGPYGLTQIEGPHWSTTNEAPGTPERVREEMKRLKVKYKLQKHGNYDTTIITEALKDGRGAAVGLRDYPSVGDYHMVTLTELTDKEFIFVENRGGCERYKASREWFNAHWTGYVITLPSVGVTVPQPVKDE